MQDKESNRRYKLGINTLYKRSVCEEDITYFKGDSIPENNNSLVEKDNSTQVYLQGELIPDVILRHSEQERYLIFDVKYKSGEYNVGTRSDRLQILAYAYVWDCDYIGHIFPEKSVEKIMEIKIPGEHTVKYIELKCSSNDEGIVLPDSYINA